MAGEVVRHEDLLSSGFFMNWEMPWLRNMKDDPRYIALKQRVLATKFSE